MVDTVVRRGLALVVLVADLGVERLRPPPQPREMGCQEACQPLLTDPRIQG